MGRGVPQHWKEAPSLYKVAHLVLEELPAHEPLHQTGLAAAHLTQQHKLGLLYLLHHGISDTRNVNPPRNGRFALARALAGSRCFLTAVCPTFQSCDTLPTKKGDRTTIFPLLCVRLDSACLGPTCCITLTSHLQDSPRDHILLRTIFAPCTITLLLLEIPQGTKNDGAMLVRAAHERGPSFAGPGATLGMWGVVLD